jgi:hypothetical protein
MIISDTGKSITPRPASREPTVIRRVLKEPWDGVGRGIWGGVGGAHTTPDTPLFSLTLTSFETLGRSKPLPVRWAARA